MEKEVTKEEFKRLYLQYATAGSGWTPEYWEKIFEHESGKRYFFTAPESPDATQLFIISDSIVRRIIFLTEDSTERFFDSS